MSVTVTFLKITPAKWNDEGTNILVPESSKAVGPVLQGDCRLSGKPRHRGADLDNAFISKVASLRDSLSRLDGALETALSQKKLLDLKKRIWKQLRKQHQMPEV